MVRQYRADPAPGTGRTSPSSIRRTPTRRSTSGGSTTGPTRSPRSRGPWGPTGRRPRTTATAT
jgi:hypothetical protein